ncbi:MAG: cytidylate kinase-like family protein [Paludibacteraceae bacterium]|nr:cytidylate kinase-like family protein [Paludibacteraceae bacterium]
MNTNNKFVITINRELGSGGRTVGRKLAEKLGVEYYDKALIKALKEKYNLTAEEIERLKGQETGWWANLKRTLSGPTTDDTFFVTSIGGEPELLEPEDVFRAETQVLKALAKENSCVIAGRTACYIFREHPNHLSIFIQASMPCRMARVAREQNMSKEEARMTIEKVDKMRENYVQEFTGTSRYDTRNYQLVINMDEINEDAAVDLILAYIREMNH